MIEMTHREFLFDDMDEPATAASFDIEKMPRREASALLWDGDAEKVLAFAAAMDVRPQLDAAMDAYNAGIVGSPMVIPFGSTDQFIVDPAIRAALAGAYNDKRNGRYETYAQALHARRLSPRKPPMRGIGEAFRHRLGGAIDDGQRRA